jgi:hypothetical protein
VAPGFLAGAAAEIFGGGPLLLQLSKFPQPVLVVTALIVAGSIIPVVKVGLPYRHQACTQHEASCQPILGM